MKKRDEKMGKRASGNKLKRGFSPPTTHVGMKNLFFGIKS